MMQMGVYIYIDIDIDIDIDIYIYSHHCKQIMFNYDPFDALVAAQ